MRVVKSVRWLNKTDKQGQSHFGIPHTEETKHKISEANKGKLSGDKNPRFGIRLFAEENGFFGKTHSEETKHKISEANKGKLSGDKNPAKRLEVREKISLKSSIRMNQPEQRELMSLKFSGDGNPSKRPEVRAKMRKPKKKVLCQFCQKEFGSNNIKRHIEAKHGEII